jgi:hypothetical protein
MARPPVSVRLLTYRSFRIEVFDEEGSGWRVIVRPPAGGHPAPEVLRNHMPAGLEPLLAEAKARIDRRVLGSAAPAGTW